VTVTIYHNPACGTSRNALAMIRNADLEPTVIEYLKIPPSRAELLDIVARMDVPLVSILRRKGTPFDALGLDGADEATLLDAIDRNPILINRPIVISPAGVRLCRPSEVVLDLLDRPQKTEFFKEDSEPVVIAVRLDARGLDELADHLATAGLPVADLGLPHRQFYRFTTTLGETAGFGGLEGTGSDRLIRSITVLPERRGRKYGKAIAQSLERLAGEGGAKSLHLLTTGAAPFFERLGYGARQRAEAPAAIAISEEFRGLCPASATYLVKTVKTSW
jgi:arsenate reductase